MKKAILISLVVIGLIIFFIFTQAESKVKVVTSSGEVLDETEVIKLKVKIPFKTTKPVKLTVQLKDKAGNPVEAKVTFWEYKPPFRVDQTFGLRWEDLDFSTVEQVFLGSLLYETKEEYFNLYYEKDREFMEKIYADGDRFEREQQERNKIALKDRSYTYFSKILLETVSKKFAMAKSILEFKGERIPGEKALVDPYVFTDVGWKYSSQVIDDFSMELFTAYRDKDTKEFIDWLKKRQIKGEHKPIVIWTVIAGGAVILIGAFFIAIKKRKHD